MSCNKYDININNCDCNKTTITTTCIPVAEKPCYVVCSDIHATDCIVYDGEDNECYGVKKGDKVKDIINNIINKIVPNNCSCEYGNASINFISTTTTTILENNLCFTLYSDLNCNVEPITITSGPFINGKVSYSFTYNSIDYIIKWSIVEDRWEFYLTSNLIDYLAYLESDSEYPIAPLKSNILTNKQSSWITATDSILITTRTSCPEELCGTFNVELVGTDNSIISVNFKSPYDTLANLPSQPVNLKHYYIGCLSFTDPEVLQIRWNLFAGRYELYFNNNFIAYTLESDLETVNEIVWVIDLDSYGTPYYEIKTKIGSCPTTTTTTIIVV